MKAYISRKESIIISAVEIIEECGINGLSLRDIAGRQGISEAALYKHFKSKEEIILAVLDYYCRYDRNIINTIENGNLESKDSIVFFVKSIVESYESHPAMTCIVSSYEVLNDDSVVVRKTKEIFISRSEYIKSLIEQGQNTGTISSKIDSEDLADAILGIKRTITLKWRIKNYSFPLKARVVTAVESLLRHF